MVVESYVNYKKTNKEAMAASSYLDGRCISHNLVGFKAKVVLFLWFISLLVANIMMHWLRMRISMFFESKFCEWENMHKAATSFNFCSFVVLKYVNIHRFDDNRFDDNLNF